MHRHALAILALAALPAQAMSPEEMEQAKLAAEQVARKEAVFTACKATNVAQLKQGFLKFGERCGASKEDLQALSGSYDGYRLQFEKVIADTRYQCPYTPQEAADKADVLAGTLEQVKCK